MGKHAPQFGCTFDNLHIIKENKCGLDSVVIFECNFCRAVLKLHTSTNDINKQAVEGAMSVGIGFNNSEELFSVLEIPYMSTTLYQKCHEIISTAWENTASALMSEAAKEEAEHAIKTGSVDKDGIPLITVVADGCWSKRSYRTNYSALSGAAAIVGQHTGKVLYLAIKNKFCSVCDRHKNKETTPPSHTCFKNYEGASTGMEAESIVEGFKLSERMHGIRYSKLIADGDSSTYKKILEARPYKNITVEKIECRNHLLRNFCNKLKAITTETRFPLELRKIVSKNIMRLRGAVVHAVAYRKETRNRETVKLLKKDIDNSIFHVLMGEHKECDSYFCKRRDIGEDNLVSKFKKCPDFFAKLNQIVSSISNHSRSLIEDVDSNVVEQFNSRIAKFVGAKRVNFSKRGSYRARCFGAVVSFNGKTPHTLLHSSLYKGRTGNFVKRLEKIRHEIVGKARQRRLDNPAKNKTLVSSYKKRHFL